jgi:uncharacterized repeat protein (TIGR01451 family)
VSLTDNAANSPQQIALSGTGLTADVGITLSGASTVKAGGTESYSVTVKNNGPGNATGVTVTDTLPATLLYKSTTGPSCTTPAVGTSGTVTCSVGGLASGASVIFTLAATVNAGKNASIVNTAKVSSTTLDSNTANNSASVTTTVSNK